jgi:hypothetical protein
MASLSSLVQHLQLRPEPTHVEHKGRVSIQNIGLGWKCWLGTNTLPYLASVSEEEAK